MILSERNKPNMLLHRKYKQISLSQVLKKPLIIKSLPPILVMSVQKPLKSNKQKSENFQSQRLSQPSILNKFNGLGAVGQSYTPIEKYLIQQQIVLMNSKNRHSRQSKINQLQKNKCQTSTDYNKNVVQRKKFELINLINGLRLPLMKTSYLNIQITELNELKT